MKVIVIIGVIAAIGALYFVSSPDQRNALFENYIAKYQKSYRTEVEYNFRRQIFEENLKYINEENMKEENTFTLGLTEFTDWTLEEFGKLMSYKPMGEIPPELEDNEEFPDIPTYHNVDWVQAGKVTQVKHQNDCGSWWAFSTVSVMESTYAINTGSLLEFSEQQLVDCDLESDGWDGGWPDKAFNYFTSHGVCLRSHYPQKDKEGSCRSKTCEKDIPKLQQYCVATRREPDHILARLYRFPLVVVISANNYIFKNYLEGVINSKDCFIRLDHAVALVGYNVETDSWLIKNSHGPIWGEHGYARIKNNHIDGSDGICGINSQISRPVW